MPLEEEEADIEEKENPPKAGPWRSCLLPLMPTGLAVGFGSKEFAYSPLGEIHPGIWVPRPALMSPVRLYSVVSLD